MVTAKTLCFSKTRAYGSESNDVYASLCHFTHLVTNLTVFSCDVQILYQTSLLKLWRNYCFTGTAACVVILKSQKSSQVSLCSVFSTEAGNSAGEVVGDPFLPETATPHTIKRIHAAGVSVLLMGLQMEDSNDIVASFIITHSQVISDNKDNGILPGDILLT